MELNFSQPTISRAIRDRNFDIEEDTGSNQKKHTINSLAMKDLCTEINWNRDDNLILLDECGFDPTHKDTLNIRP